MRHDALDVARGAAFVLMLVHHAAYFGSMTGGPAVPAVAEAAGSAARYAFILLAGVSLGQRGARLARLAEIAAHAALVSVATRLLLPDRWVRFGILHFMCAGLLITTLLLRAEFAGLALGLALLCVGRTGLAPLDLALGHAPARSMDYFPLQRWLPVLWLGVLLARVPIPAWRAETLAPRALAALGRNTLALYTAHYLAGCAIVRLRA
jgi:uncharacterized membrane protein